MIGIVTGDRVVVVVVVAGEPDAGGRLVGGESSGWAGAASDVGDAAVVGVVCGAGDVVVVDTPRGAESRLERMAAVSRPEI